MFGHISISLKEVVEINRGKRLVRNQLTSTGNYPVYQNSMIPLGYYDKSNCKKNTTFVIAAGAAGEIGYCQSDFWAADDCYYFDCKDNLISKYLYYLLQSKKSYILSRVRKASIPRISREVFENMLISVPTLQEQKRVVMLLDCFDEICNDLSVGIPAEIEARKKQYEYYRDKLLAFNELKDEEI